MNLNEAKFLVTKDNEKMIRSIHELKNQCLSVWKSASFYKFKNIDNVVVCGMGGSALGAHIIRSVFGDEIKSPFFILNNYKLPDFVGKNSLVILSSYSGNTEEVLFCLGDAKKRKAKIIALSSGGLLEKDAKQNKIPVIIFDTSYNPSGEPRMGLGYSLFGILRILNDSGLIKINKQKIIKPIQNLGQYLKEWGIDNLIKNNLAKQLAQKLYGKIPVIVGSEFLVGNLHAFQNQLHESSKNFACYFELPEFNHHLMEGLANPKENKRLLAFVFFESDLYSKENQKRYSLTKEVIRKNKVNFINYKLKSKDKLSGSLEVLLLGSFISFYLSVLNRTNPLEIPWVDYFKKRLK